MSQSRCPTCELFGAPPERVNFIIITGLPWNSVRFRIRRWLFERGTDRIDINNRTDLSDYQSLSSMDNPILATQKCCFGSSLTLLEGFDKTDPFVWRQFTQAILRQLERKGKPEDGKGYKRAEPVSWVIIDDKRCMEREHLDFFLQLKDYHEPLLSYTFTIICVIGHETQLFQNCILECVNCHEYESSVYPDYQRRLQGFLKSFNASSTLQHRTLFIEQNEEFRALLLNLPTKVSNYGARKEAFLQHVRNMLSPCRRTVHDINTFRSNIRKEYGYVVNEQVESLFSRLQNATTAQSAVHEIIRTVLIEFKCMGTEQRRAYEQKLICGLNANDAKYSHTIAAHLTRWSLQLIGEPGNTAIPLVYSIILVICTLGKHRHFCHELYNSTSEIYTLSMSLVCQRQYALVLAGLRLCKTILDSDGLEHKYAIAYLKYDKLASRKIMDAIQWLLTPFDALKIAENQCVRRAAILVSHKYTQCLGSLLYGSVQHCAQITIEDVNQLVETIDILVDDHLSNRKSDEKPFTLMLVSDLCSILCPILQYGLSEVALALRCKTSLLKAIPEATRFLLQYGKELADPCIRLYTMLIRSIFKDSKTEYVPETEQFVTVPMPITTNVESKMLPNTIRDTTLALNEDLISSYFELSCKYQDVLLQGEKSTTDEAEQLWKKEREKLHQKEFELDHARLIEENKSMQQKISQLHDELQRTRSHRDQLESHINEFRPISVASLSAPSQPSVLLDSTTERNEESINLRLENLSLDNITKEQAESFIKQIYHRRVTFNDHDMRKSICGSLKHLGSDLYSSPVHFLHELIQNAEDNAYAPTVTPRLRIVIDHDFILLSNNEQGLRACDVSAICSLAVSTKQLNEHIGEKGVGFKSVFAATNQPTLISHAWTFNFQIPGPDEMSYITPRWIDDDAIPPKIRHRIKEESLDTYLYLPLKLRPFSPEAEDFLDQVARATDSCILINLRKLEKLEIVDERNNETSLVTKRILAVEKSQWQESTKFEGFTFINLTESLIQLENGSTQNSFRVYTANITIPTAGRTNRIILAFPCELDCQLTYNVYAGLPVCNLGFNFLFNADFQLVTNRERKSIRRFNEDFASLVSRAQLFDCADIQIIGKEDGIFTDERLKTFQVEPVSIVDVLNCFPKEEDQSNASRRQFWHWAQGNNIHWWNKLYQHIDRSMTDELGSLLLKKPIFLLQTNSHRQYLAAHTTTSRGRYVTENPSLQMWKRHLILLRCTSLWERNALLKSKQVQLLTDERLIHIILCDHIQIALSSMINDANEIQIEEVWEDLAYLKSKIDFVNKSDRFLVPVRGSLRLAPIHDATLPTILGVNIEEILHTSNRHVICFPYKPNSVHDSLEWEDFFLKMSCQKPKIDLSLNRELVLRSFLMYNNIKLAEEIFSSQSVETQDCLRQFPICAHVDGHEEIYPVSATFDKTIVKDFPYLPQVDIPLDCRSLAKMLDVICDYDLRACVTILQVLTDQKNTDLTLYIHWLGHLQLYLRQQRTDSQFPEVLSSCHIYLPDHQQFRPLKDLFVVEDHTDHRTTIELVSKYLNFPIISPSINQIYWQFKDLFDVLNCTCAVNLSHLIQTINLASRDTNNFHVLGDGTTVLKEMFAEKMVSLYQHVETLILKCVIENKSNDLLYNAIVGRRHPSAPCGSREDWEWRFGLMCTEISSALRILIGLNREDKQFPLLTSDRELTINTNGTLIYACMEQQIIENLAKDAGKRFFIAPLISNTCPLLLAALDIDYVERRCLLGWIHKNSNIEKVLEKVTDIFRETLEDPQIEVVTARYAHVMLYLSDLTILNPNDGDPPGNIDFYTIDSNYQFWIFNKIVCLRIDMIREYSNQLVIATSALATLLHKRKLMPIEMAKSIAQQKIHERVSFSTTKPASIASVGPQYYSCTDVIFPIHHDLSIGTSSILLQSSFDIGLDSSRSEVPTVTMERRAEDHLYRNRVKHQDHRTLILENSKKPADPKIVDYHEKIRIGEKAEHFFFRYLQKEYGESYITPTENWCSSNRQKLFPGYLRGIDDAIGYDFKLHDRREIFVKGSGTSTIKCYFEVKGTAGSFDVGKTPFHISQNERQMCQTIGYNEQRKQTEAYLIVIIEHCLDPEKIGLAALINWSENFNLIHTSPDSYICYIVLPSASGPKETQQSSVDNPPSKPRPYIPPHRRNRDE